MRKGERKVVRRFTLSRPLHAARNVNRLTTLILCSPLLPLLSFLVRLAELLEDLGVTLEVHLVDLRSAGRIVKPKHRQARLLFGIQFRPREFAKRVDGHFRQRGRLGWGRRAVRVPHLRWSRKPHAWHL